MSGAMGDDDDDRGYACDVDGGCEIDGVLDG